MSTTFTQVSFADLLERAVTEPGQLHAALRAFHNYSLGNQILAMWQCAERGIPVGPIASFMSWKAKGRSVRKGQKALVLCMPVTSKRTVKQDDGSEETVAFTRFVYRPHWFALAQTDGADVAPEPLPSWDTGRALGSLNIQEVPFALLNGNCWGYAQGREIAISPVCPEQHRTRFHEIAHVLLGHTTGERMTDGAQPSRELRELEAECVALLVGAALNLPGEEYSRGYIQNWWRAGNPVPEKSAQRIMKVADQILKAGFEPAEAAIAA